MINSKLFINGESLNAQNNEVFKSLNPANGEVIAKIAHASSVDVDLAVQSSRKAFQNTWGRKSHSERGLILNMFASQIQANGEELARLDSLETGRIFADCLADVDAAVSIIRFFAGLTDKITGSTLPVQEGYTAFTKREPYGVIAAIFPWNYPIFNACAKLAPILAMGNTCILKPAEEASLSAIKIAEIGLESGLPSGALNVVTGYGETTGEALTYHSGIDKISFTGSTEVGRKVMAASAASNLKPLTLELGGKSPMILFEDCNIEAALDSAVLSVFFNQGQTCTAATRLLVQGSIVSEVISNLKKIVEKIKVGNPLEETNQMGAIVSKKQFNRINDYIRLGIKEGANLIAGGLTELENSGGYFIRPTIFSNVNSNMKISQEEIFGPVLSIISFNSEEEAIELANGVSYGLAASIWTRDASRLHRLAGKVESGVIWGNCVFVENPVAPVGGYKQSGFGKEFGLEAAYECTRQKTVWIDFTDTAYKWIE